MVSAALIRAALAHQNVIAFSAVIRFKESSNDDSAYFMVNGAPPLTDLSRYPFDNIPAPPGRASGAGQFIPHTWHALARLYPDDMATFERPAQDFAIVANIADSGALDDVIAGRFDGAVAKLRKQWVSLPGGSDSHWTMDAARVLYAQHGGAMGQPGGDVPPATAGNSQGVNMASVGSALGSAAPIIAAINPAAGLIAGLASSLIQAFAPLAQEKLARELGRHTDDPTVAQNVAAAIVASAQSVTGKPDPVDAVVAAKADPAVVATVQADALAKLDELAPFLDRIASYAAQSAAVQNSGMDAAAMRRTKSRADSALANFLGRTVVGMVAIIAAALAAALGLQIAFDPTHKPDPTLMTLFSGVVGVILGNWGQVFNFEFGPKQSDPAVDSAIAELQARRPK